MDTLRSSAILFLFVCTSLGATLPQGEMLVRSADLGIEHGTKIQIDGRLVGTAPCEISLKTKIRHKFELKSRDGKLRTYYLTARNLKKSEEVENIPAWFFDPRLLKSDFPGYVQFTPATSASSSIVDAISKAETTARTKMTTIAVNQYNTIRAPDNQNKLDSSKSRYYPKLTRGQMDSLNHANGGTMVVSSLSRASKVVFLEYEIQEIANQNRVYVLAGEKR